MNFKILLIFSVTLIWGIFSSQDVENYPTRDVLYEIEYNYTQKKIERLEEENRALQEWVDFMEAIGMRESSDRYHISRGQYWGRYQMGNLARIDLNMNVNRNYFLSNTKLQDEAFIRYLEINRRYLGSYLDYVGETINGVEITESGLLAASHLVGAQGVKRMLRSRGTFIPRDGNNTSALEYLSEFGNYDIRFDININEIIEHNGKRKTRRDS